MWFPIYLWQAYFYTVFILCKMQDISYIIMDAFNNQESTHPGFIYIQMDMHEDIIQTLPKTDHGLFSNGSFLYKRLHFSASSLLFIQNKHSTLSWCVCDRLLTRGPVMRRMWYSSSLYTRGMQRLTKPQQNSLALGSIDTASVLGLEASMIFSVVILEDAVRGLALLHRL